MTEHPIVDFLLARIAEDEADAHHVSRWATFIAGDGGLSGGYTSMEGRVLAECQAKRAIIEHEFDNIAEDDAEYGDGCTVEELRAGACRDPRVSKLAAGGDPILRDLALLYADHPDYRQEWKP